MLLSLRFFGFLCYNQWFAVLQPVGFNATTMLEKKLPQTLLQPDKPRSTTQTQNKPKTNPKTQPPGELLHTKLLLLQQKETQTEK
jgi:hypothetical protein